MCKFKLFLAVALMYLVCVAVGYAEGDKVLPVAVSTDTPLSPSSTVAPPSSTVAPPSSTVAPPSSTVAPPSSTVAPPSSTATSPSLLGLKSAVNISFQKAAFSEKDLADQIALARKALHDRVSTNPAPATQDLVLPAGFWFREVYLNRPDPAIPGKINGSQHAAVDSFPLLVILNDLSNAMLVVANRDYATAQEYVVEWQQVEPSFYHNYKSEPCLFTWKAILEKWRSELVKVPPERFKDALYQSSLSLARIGLETERLWLEKVKAELAKSPNPSAAAVIPRAASQPAEGATPAESATPAAEDALNLLAEGSSNAIVFQPVYPSGSEKQKNQMLAAVQAMSDRIKTYRAAGVSEYVLPMNFWLNEIYVQRPIAQGSTAKRSAVETDSPHVMLNDLSNAMMVVATRDYLNPVKYQQEWQQVQHDFLAHYQQNLLIYTWKGVLDQWLATVNKLPRDKFRTALYQGSLSLARIGLRKEKEWIDYLKKGGDPAQSFLQARENGAGAGAMINTNDRQRLSANDPAPPVNNNISNTSSNILMNPANTGAPSLAIPQEPASTLPPPPAPPAAPGPAAAISFTPIPTSEQDLANQITAARNALTQRLAANQTAATTPTVLPAEFWITEVFLSRPDPVVPGKVGGSKHTASDAFPFLVILNDLSNAMQIVSARNFTDPRDYLKDWQKVAPLFLEHYSTDPCIFAWKEILQKWQAELSKQPPEKFKDALLEGSLSLARIGLETEKLWIEQAKSTNPAGSSRTSGSNSGSGSSRYHTSHALSWHHWRMSRIIGHDARVRYYHGIGR